MSTDKETQSSPTTMIESGKIVLVLGASSGIGAAISEALSEHNVKLFVFARRVNLLDELIEKCKKREGKYKAISMESVGLDVTKRVDVVSAFEKIANEHGSIDSVICVAGVMYFTLMKNMKWEEWEQTIEVNVKGTVNGCGAALPYLLKSKNSPHIVNISSDAARQTFPALTVYNASKAFVHEFSKGLRCELVGTGVRLTEIQPGDVRTDLIMKNSDTECAKKVGVEIGVKIGGNEEWNDVETAEKRNSYLDPKDVANSVIYALTTPKHIGINEILIEPRDQMYGDPTSMNVE